MAFAVIHFQNALTAAPIAPGLQAELGEVLLRAGKVNQAIRELMKSCEAVLVTCVPWCGAAKQC